MTWFVGLSILGSLFYGTSDFFGGLAARRLNLLRATAVTYLFATIAAAVGLIVVGGEWSTDDAALGAVAGLLAIVGFVTFYAALAIGPMSLLSPAIALVGAIVPVGVAAATGRALEGSAWIAITLAILATVLISVPAQRARERVTLRGGILALVSGLGLGGSVVVLDLTATDSGLVAGFVEMGVGLVILLVLLGLLHVTRARFGLLAVFEPPPASARQGLSSRRAWVMSGAAGILLGIANSLFIVALHSGQLAIVSVLISLYPLATVVLAAIVLRERVSWLQYSGIALAVIACVILALGAAPTPAEGREPGGSDDLLWSDEFDGPAGERPSDAVWTTESGNREQEGWWNNELQFYTDDASTSSLDGDGHLVLSALRAPAGADLPCWPSGDCAFTSARLTTEGTVALEYGRIDVRAKIPTGTGLLPAIWMLGNNGVVWPGQGEIDIVEVVGGEPRTVYGTVHGPTYFNADGINGTVELDADASDDFHVYSIDKRPGVITWLVDDEPYFTLTPEDLPAPEDWVFDQDMHLLLNVAVGGDWPGAPGADTAFPASMSVDYVRLYGTGTAPRD